MDAHPKSTGAQAAKRWPQRAAKVRAVLPELQFVFFRQIVIDGFRESFYMADEEIGFKSVSGAGGRDIPEGNRVVVSCEPPYALSTPEKEGKF